MVQREVFQILEILKTNSTPIKVLCDDGLVYYIKTCFNTNPPLVDIINEFVGNYVYKTWEINVPEICLVKMDSNILLDYVAEHNLNCRYSAQNLNNLFFIGSKEISEQLEVEPHLLGAYTRQQVNKLKEKSKIIDIATCDIWIANKDRRISNPNLLMNKNGLKFDFIAIDHTQLFGDQSDYKGLKIALMEIDKSNMLISSGLVKSIGKFISPNVYKDLQIKYANNIQNTIDGMSTFFINLPSEIGLSKKGKERIINVLSNKERNEKIVALYKSFI